MSQFPRPEYVLEISISFQTVFGNSHDGPSSSDNYCPIFIPMKSIRNFDHGFGVGRYIDLYRTGFNDSGLVWKLR